MPAMNDPHDKDAATLRRFLGTPLNLAEWAENRDAFPGPYRVTRPLLDAMVVETRVRALVTSMAHHAPWLLPQTGVMTRAIRGGWV